MSKKDTDLLEWLQSYDVPIVSEKKIEVLISKGKNYIDSPDFNKNSFSSILLSQLQCLSISFWVVQISLLVASIIFVCLLGRIQVQYYYPLTVLAVIIPLLVLLGVKEISKSSTYDMWELEQSSRCQLTKIAACRMLIVGLFDLAFVTGIVMLMSYYYQYSIIETILYGMVPFNISCSCYLFITVKVDKEENSYYMIACMACLIVIFSFILRQQIIFETSMVWIWAIFYVISVLFLGRAIQIYLKNEKKIGELVWNLH